jgi:type I restriction enzyme S subunit
MALSRLGEYIEIVEGKNSNGEFDLSNIKGISTKKVFIPTKANMDGISLSNYKLVQPMCFAYVADTSRRGDKISLAFNDTNEVILVSSITTVFRVKPEAKLIPIYLYMYFNRPEFDRYSRFNSWGSAREAFGWEDMCEIEIDIPSIEVQQKVVDVYLAMVANQKAYEKGLDDLKLTCDAYIENIREKQESHKLVDFLEETKEINTEKTVLFERGLNKFKGFVKPSAMSNNVDLSKRKVVRFNHFVYPSPHFGEQGTIGLFKEEACIMSQMYTTFRVIDNRLNPDYLYLWFKRNEFMRYAFFAASDSVRDTFDFTKLCDYKIPVPSQTIQKNIVEVYETYEMRKKINENLKEQINDICPVLIKGSIDLNH